MWYEINNIMKKDILIKIYTGKKESCERLFGFYLEHHKLRKQQKIKERMIYPIKDRDLANKRKNNLTEIKFSNLKNDAEWGVLGDVFFIQTSIGKKPHSFLIKDKFFASTFEQIFDQLWKAAK